MPSEKLCKVRPSASFISINGVCQTQKKIKIKKNSREGGQDRDGGGLKGAREDASTDFVTEDARSVVRPTVDGAGHDLLVARSRGLEYYAVGRLDPGSCRVHDKFFCNMRKWVFVACVPSKAPWSGNVS
jgi:hypothetical protein